MNKPIDDFDWSPRGEEFWRALAKAAVVRSEQAIRFSVVKDRGPCTNTYAAKLAGAKGDPTNAGFRLSKSAAVATLDRELKIAKGETAKKGSLEWAEAMEEIAAMVRTGDPQTKARGLELNLKYEALAREDAARGARQYTVEQATRAMFDKFGVKLGSLVITALNIHQDKNVFPNHPYNDVLLPAMKRYWPEAWQMMLVELPPSANHYRDTLVRIADGPMRELPKTETTQAKGN